MAPKTLSPCSVPGCPTLTDTARCDEHRREYRRNQAADRRAAGDPAMTAYHGDWPRRRAKFLRSHPTCVDCSAPATVPDHVPPRRLLLELGIADPDNDRWLRPRCEPCHDRKTQTIDKPLLARFHAGEDPKRLAEEAMT